MYNICYIFILCNQRYDLGFSKHRAHAGDHNVLLPRKSPCAHLLQRKSECPGHHLKKTSRSGRTFIVHQEIFDRAIFINTDRFDILPSDIDDGPDIRVQIMCPFCMAGNLCNAVIPAVNIGTSISRRHNPDNRIFLNSRLFHCQIQTLLRTQHRAATGRNDHGRFDFSVLIQDHHIGTGRSAVNSCHIVNA